MVHVLITRQSTNDCSNQSINQAAKQSNLGRRTNSRFKDGICQSNHPSRHRTIDHAVIQSITIKLSILCQSIKYWCTITSSTVWYWLVITQYLSSRRWHNVHYVDVHFLFSLVLWEYSCRANPETVSPFNKASHDTIGAFCCCWTINWHLFLLFVVV